MEGYARGGALLWGTYNICLRMATVAFVRTPIMSSHLVLDALGINL